MLSSRAAKTIGELLIIRARNLAAADLHPRQAQLRIRAFLARGQAVVNGGTCGNCLSCELAAGGGQAVNERVDIGVCY